jgi:hypothetical protein
MIPGADRPPAGMSLFDRLTTGPDGRQDIPFPFEHLIARIEAAAGCSADQPCTRSVLIPLGRSLQRVAASPDFFTHPRIVTAVVRDGGGKLLRDRLYLGFQDRASVMEVISYNETLGRFEFQIVDNYAAGRQPQATYARRTVCVSCHQNHGPIFSQQVWLETNANPAIADRLSVARKVFSGVDARGNTDIAQSIDDATDRANRLMLTQRLWTEGCGEGDAGTRCRRAAFVASLQFALTGGRGYANGDEDFQTAVVARLAQRAGEVWPAGLSLPDPDIPNRDPLIVPAEMTGPALANVDVRFDPLVPRGPLETLAVGDGRGMAHELVRGLSEFWAARDRIALTARLASGPAKRHRTTASCRISGSAEQEQFDCAGDASVRLKGTLDGTRGTIDEIRVGNHQPLRHLPVAVSRSAASMTLTIRDIRHNRLADGDSLQRIELRRTTVADGVAHLDVREDFTAFTASIAAHAFEPMPLRSDLLSQIVLAKVDARDALPLNARVDSYSAVAPSADPLIVALESQCGSCHHTEEVTPPNFLSGGSQRATLAIESCAPRILVRLAMRDRSAGDRVKTPMPPEFVLDDRSYNHRGAADDRALAELRARIEALLQKREGQPPSVDRLLAKGYEALPTCLPASMGGIQ